MVDRGWRILEYHSRTPSIVLRLLSGVSSCEKKLLVASLIHSVFVLSPTALPGKQSKQAPWVTADFAVCGHTHLVGSCVLSMYAPPVA